MEQELRKYLVIPYDISTCRLWGEIRANCSKIGQPISPQDAWIAATARQYNLPLVTHNPEDFEAVENLEIITTAS
ncbi:MAG: PIN domain-containing protein, partial [Candidatus Heimdallarchaeota archaeon]